MGSADNRNILTLFASGWLVQHQQEPFLPHVISSRGFDDISRWLGRVYTGLEDNLLWQWSNRLYQSSILQQTFCLCNCTPSYSLDTTVSSEVFADRRMCSTFVCVKQLPCNCMIYNSVMVESLFCTMVMKRYYWSLWVNFLFVGCCM